MDLKESIKIQKLYEIYEQPMYRIAYAFLHNREMAEDAVSEAFVRIIGKINRLGDAESPKTKSYIVKVIKSTSIGIYRRNKRKYMYEQPIDDNIMQLSDPLTDVEDKIIAGSTGEIMNGLEETDRTIVMFRCRYEMPYKEIAQRTSMSEAAVRKRFERAKRRIIKLRGENPNEN
ncbi:MAG: sigma-70 family RNA polymerase sigma factor [Ruminococcus sp.]|jgi:RNA polymerase sigma-70 factor (ECF subfamily)|nr:sigma-70 family RNA polymerase sigma factor [Ruminococcus sp.]